MLICICNFDEYCTVFCRHIILCLIHLCLSQRCSTKQCSAVFEEIKNIGLKGIRECGEMKIKKRELQNLKNNRTRQKSNIQMSFNFLLSTYSLLKHRGQLGSLLGPFNC